ncbi:MAG: hypothetical protein ACRYFK_08300 [Janthinobacterium lividum]
MGEDTGTVLRYEQTVASGNEALVCNGSTLLASRPAATPERYPAGPAGPTHPSAPACTGCA